MKTKKLRNIFLSLSYMLFFILSSNNSHGQDCEYRKNEVDHFTGKMTKQTEKIVLFETRKSMGYIYIQKIDDKYSYYFVVDASFSVRRAVTNGSELSFLLESEKIITLKKTDDDLYPISKDNLLEMLKSRIKSVRIEYETKKGKAKEDADIKRKKAEKFIELIKCVI